MPKYHMRSFGEHALFKDAWPEKELGHTRIHLNLFITKATIHSMKANAEENNKKDTR